MKIKLTYDGFKCVGGCILFTDCGGGLSGLMYYAVLQDVVIKLRNKMEACESHSKKYSIKFKPHEVTALAYALGQVDELSIGGYEMFVLINVKNELHKAVSELQNKRYAQDKYKALDGEQGIYWE